MSSRAFGERVACNKDRGLRVTAQVRDRRELAAPPACEAHKRRLGGSFRANREWFMSQRACVGRHSNSGSAAHID